MVHMLSPFPVPRAVTTRHARVPFFLVVLALGASAGAQDLIVAAKVDKTTVDLGEPINLTLTLSGDVSDVQLPPLNLPEGFIVLGRSQSTSFSIRAGAMERAMSLNVVLLPQQLGTFQLGPFIAARGKQRFQTQPIEITVKKTALPPHLKSDAERYIL